MGFLGSISKSISVNLPGVGGSLSVNDTKAIIVVFFLFLTLLLLAKMSRSYLSWYMSGWFIWLFLGFLLAVLVEGLLLVSGRTIFTEVLSLENAPRPVQEFIDAGRYRLTDVVCEE